MAKDEATVAVGPSSVQTPDERPRTESTESLEVRIDIPVPPPRASARLMPPPVHSVHGRIGEVPRVAGYEIVRLLGQGGMGAAWEAIETRFDRRVALKVHKASGTPAEAEARSRELWSEAYLAARIGDPGIVRVHDVGLTLDEQPYYTMDLVEGTELAAMIAEGPVPLRRAVELGIDIARATAAAHENGIIHCDLKARNVLVDAGGRARVLDFGIARSVRAPQATDGNVMGTPAYMAPEQMLGEPLGPATDVYAIGVLLYEMLAGRKPFTYDAIALLALVPTEPPPPLRDLAPSVPPELAAIVEQCLEKRPGDRFPTGRALVETLQAYAEGRPLSSGPLSRRGGYAPKSITSRPPPPSRPKREEAKKHFTWTWQLKSPPDKLWPHVANTDRFNRSVGLAPVDFADDVTDEGTSQRSGSMRTLGMNIQWREFPFEWLRAKEHAVFRWYKSGPIDAMWNRVRLAPAPDGGTILTHEIWISPRGVLGSLATFVEIATKLKKNAERSYRRMDQLVASGSTDDPFEEPYVPTAEQREIAFAAFQRLGADGFARPMLERVAQHLLTAPTPIVAAMRPLALAQSWGMDGAELLDLFLHAAHVGLLEIAWDIVCPTCLVAHETVASLAHVRRVGRCDACASTFERDLASSVELVFRPHPNLRSTDRVKYCAGAPALRPHVHLQQLLEPGETRVVQMDVATGPFQLAVAFAKSTADLAASAMAYGRECTVTVTDEGLTISPPTVLPGTLTVTLVNASDRDQTIRMQDATTKRDAVAASAAVTHPTFREFFADDLLALGERLAVGKLTFVFVHAEDRTRLLRDLGDEKACELLASLDSLVREELARHEGTDVPAVLGLQVGAFASGEKAALAALTILRRARTEVAGAAVRIGVHQGPCLALTRSDRLEYFGETLERGLALLADAPPNGIAFSAGVVADRGVAARVYQGDVATQVAASSQGPYGGRRITTLTLAS